MERPRTELSRRQVEMAHRFLFAREKERTRYSEAEWRSLFEEELAFLAEEDEEQRHEIAAEIAEEKKRRRKTPRREPLLAAYRRLTKKNAVTRRNETK